MSQQKGKENASKVILKATPHFLVSELACKCCGEMKCPPNALIFFEAVRVEVGRAYIPNSVYRCESHNKAVGGEKDSAHTKGLAMDIPCVGGEGAFRSKLIRAAIKHGAVGIGVYKTFIHIDIMPRALPVVWVG